MTTAWKACWHLSSRRVLTLISDFARRTRIR